MTYSYRNVLFDSSTNICAEKAVSFPSCKFVKVGKTGQPVLGIFLFGVEPSIKVVTVRCTVLPPQEQEKIPTPHTYTMSLSSPITRVSTKLSTAVPSLGNFTIRQ